MRRKVGLGTAMVLMGVLLAVLVVVLAYGNDYTSCQRTAATRVNANERLDLASEFWTSTVAETRARSATNARSFAAQLRVLQTSDAPLRDSFVEYVLTQADIDDGAAVAYRDFADKQRQLKAVVPDCSKLPPPGN